MGEHKYHGVIICKECDAVVLQCRCPDGPYMIAWDGVPTSRPTLKTGLCVQHGGPKINCEDASDLAEAEDVLKDVEKHGTVKWTDSGRSHEAREDQGESSDTDSSRDP